MAHIPYNNMTPPRGAGVTIVLDTEESIQRTARMSSASPRDGIGSPRGTSPPSRRDSTRRGSLGSPRGDGWEDAPRGDGTHLVRLDVPPLTVRRWGGFGDEQRMKVWRASCGLQMESSA